MDWCFGLVLWIGGLVGFPFTPYKKGFKFSSPNQCKPPTTVDGRNPTPPEKHWNDDSPANTNLYWSPMVSKGCRISSIHSRGKVPLTFTPQLDIQCHQGPATKPVDTANREALQTTSYCGWTKSISHHQEILAVHDCPDFYQQRMFPMVS